MTQCVRLKSHLQRFDLSCWGKAETSHDWQHEILQPKGFRMTQRHCDRAARTWQSHTTLLRNTTKNFCSFLNPAIIQLSCRFVKRFCANFSNFFGTFGAHCAFVPRVMPHVPWFFMLRSHWESGDSKYAPLQVYAQSLNVLGFPMSWIAMFARLGRNDVASFWSL